MESCVGNVIRILDEYTLIVDSGCPVLSVGDKVQVFEPAESIMGLDGTDLGEFVFIKDELEVVQVEPKYSICKKRKTVKRVTTPSLALSPLLEKTSLERVPLNVDTSDLNPLPEISKTIHIGDKVRIL